jgi:hypothetical protein
MTLANVRRAFALIVLLAWVHLAFGLYPLPSQKAAEIAKLADDAVATDRSLRSKGISEQLLPKITAEEYVEALTEEYWRDWALGTTLLLLGVVAAGVTYRGYKYWPWLTALVSLAYAAMLVYPMLSHSIGPDRSFSWATFFLRDAMAGGFQLKTLWPIYALFILPLLHLAIVILALLISRYDNSQSLHSSVA